MERTYSEDEIENLTERVRLLQEHIAKGKMHIVEHLKAGFEASMAAIRFRADGKVDPSTVDGRIRAMTLSILLMKQREEAKKSISLAAIQEEYFRFLFEQFGELYEPMQRAGANPQEAATVVARNERMVEHLVAGLPDLNEGLQSFWASVSEAAAYHLQDGSQLKATFSGDLFPPYWENMVSTAGLYVDTIVLPCPISRIAPLVGHAPPKELAEVLVKHVLNAMSYRDLAVADVDPPLVLVVPNQNDVHTEQRDELSVSCIPLALQHAKYLFGRTFESGEHLADFCKALVSPEQVINELKGRDRLLFDSEWDDNPRVQLSEAMKASNYAIPAQGHAGFCVLSNCLGRMPQAKAALINSEHFGGTPLLSSETSWRYYTWMLEYMGAAQPKSGEEQQTMHVVRALTGGVGPNLEWLGKVPPKTVLEIRKKGLAQDVRSILSQGISDLVGLAPDNYFRTADQVVENIGAAFKAHQQQLSEAKMKKLKFFGLDVPSCIAVGGVGVAAALTGNTTLGAISGVLGVAGFSTLKDLKSKYSEIAASEAIRRSSPTGLLFKHLD